MKYWRRNQSLQRDTSSSPRGGRQRRADARRPARRETLAETLVDCGFDVVTAANGREALMLLRATSPERRPGAILLDLMMPVMDGYAFLEEQREDPELSAIPVAIVTAGHGVDRYRLGEAPVVSKPINLPKLLEVLRVSQTHN